MGKMIKFVVGVMGGDDDEVVPVTEQWLEEEIKRHDLFMAFMSGKDVSDFLQTLIKKCLAGYIIDIVKQKNTKRSRNAGVEETKYVLHVDSDADY